jgi:hypothetical protein
LPKPGWNYAPQAHSRLSNISLIFGFGWGLYKYSVKIANGLQSSCPLEVEIKDIARAFN